MCVFIYTLLPKGGPCAFDSFQKLKPSRLGVRGVEKESVSSGDGGGGEGSVGGQSVDVGCDLFNEH